MVVRSSVIQPRRGPEDDDREDRTRALKREILDECRRRIEAMRDDPKER